MNIALIFAGGIGKRMNIDIPKQFLQINSVPVIVRTIKNFQQNKNIDKIYVVTRKDDINYMLKLSNDYNLTKVVSVVAGGKTGQDSIYNGLVKINEENPSSSIVLIHDGVRPIINNEIISKNIEMVKKYGNSITCSKCKETIVTVCDDKVCDAVDRDTALTAQAPQSFILEEILSAHEHVRKTNPSYSGIIDSCTLMKSLKKDLHIIIGNFSNIKITTKDDYFVAKALIECQNIDIDEEAYANYINYEGDNHE